MDLPPGFAEWARQAVPGLYRRAKLLTGEHHAAEDLTQETLTKIYVAWPKLDFTRNVDGYAMRTLYHEFVSLRRRATPAATDELPELLQPDADPTAAIDLARAPSFRPSLGRASASPQASGSPTASARPRRRSSPPPSRSSPS